MAILDVIKSDAPNGLLVWKHPAEDFNTLSTLIVDESQVALLYRNGQIADVFTAGRYVLSTQNIPVLRKLLELPTGGVSTFRCRVYYVNMTEAMNMKWGLNSRVTYMEPTYGIPLELGARGAMSIRIADPRHLVVRLVGSEASLTAQGLMNYFRSLIVMKVKSHLARTIRDQQLNIFELNGHLDILAEELKARIAPDLESYGFRLHMFTVDEVLLPEDNPAFLRVKRALSERTTGLFEAQTQSQKAVIAAQGSANVEVIKAQGHAEALRVQGTNYREERQLDISEKMAENPNMNQFSGMAGSMAMMAGTMAMGVQSARSMSEAMSSFGSPAGMTGFTQAAGINYAQPAPAPQPVPQPAAAPRAEAPQPDAAVRMGTKKCKACGAELPLAAKFCIECGAVQPKRCPSCGVELPDNAKFCIECGAKLS